MPRILISVTLFLVFSGVAASAADPDPIRERLDKALASYRAALDAARTELLALIESEERDAQKSANLFRLKQVRADREALNQQNELPKTVSTNLYLLKAGRAWEQANLTFAQARDDYTRSGQVEKAEATEKERLGLKSYQIKAASATPQVTATVTETAETISTALSLAEATYKVDVARIEQMIKTSLDRREDAARTSGSKDWVDLVTADRKEFTTNGRIPPATPRDIWNQAVAARTRYAAAMERAISGFTRIKLDSQATMTERQMNAFLNKTGYLNPSIVPVAWAAVDGVPVSWRFTTARPLPTWSTPNFDDAAWGTGLAPFGAGAPRVATRWASKELWMRREIELPVGKWVNLHVRSNHDDQAIVFLNGVQAFRFNQWSDNRHVTAPVSAEALKTLKPGLNTLAVFALNYKYSQYIDVGLVDMVDAKKK